MDVMTDEKMSKNLLKALRNHFASMLTQPDS